MSFEELIERQIDIVTQEKNGSGRPVIGTLCSYVPVEILHSMGVIPMRLWGQADDIYKADALLQSYICPPVRHLMAMGLEGRYDFLDGIVHCYTCDATCGLFNIWVRNLEPRFSHMISLPYMSIDEALEYAVAEYRVLIDKLESFTHNEFSGDALEKAIALYGEARSQMLEIYGLKSRGLSISYAEVYSMNVCSQVLPVEMMVKRLEEYLEEAKRKEPDGGRGRRTLLTGSVITDIPLMAFIEDAGCNIVADDTCLGLRLLGEPMPGGGDPLERLASWYMARPPCASRADFPSRRRFLLDTLDAFEITAVVFAHQKFCDPHLSDYPFLKKVLEEAGVPSLHLEMEGEGFTGQIQTRLESFFEMLEAG